MNSDSADISITDYFTMTLWEPCKSKTASRRRTVWKSIVKSVKESLKKSGRYKQYDGVILGRQVFKWSLELSCFDFRF